jgi:hypothetical protein
VRRNHLNIALRKLAGEFGGVGEYEVQFAPPRDNEGVGTGAEKFGVLIVWGWKHAKGEHLLFANDVNHSSTINNHEGFTARIHKEAAAGLGVASEDNEATHAACQDLDRESTRKQDAEESGIFVGVLREEEAPPKSHDR